MKNILLVCDTEEIAHTVEDRVSLDNRYKLTKTPMNGFRNFLSEQFRFDVVIFDCWTLDKKELQLLQRLTALMKNIRIMILANQISIYSYQQVDSLENMVTLQKPFQDNVFMALLNKVAFEQNFRPTRCPRFITDVPARMIHMKTGILIPTRMKNYSAGGAFLEYRGISLKVGDQIQISVTGRVSPRPEADMLMNAKVIWIKDGEHARSPMRGVGVQFLGSIPTA